jgi:hypothetical protein
MWGKEFRRDLFVNAKLYKYKHGLLQHCSKKQVLTNQTDDKDIEKKT